MCLDVACMIAAASDDSRLADAPGSLDHSPDPIFPSERLLKALANSHCIESTQSSVNLCTAGYDYISARALLILIESLLKVQSHLLLLGKFSWKKYSIFNWKTCNRGFCEEAKYFLMQLSQLV